MKTIESLDELMLPQKHKSFLEFFLQKATIITNRNKIERLILFGSCARGDATDKSDIDLAAVGEDIDDETLWELYDCVPEYTPGSYIDNDIIVITNKMFDDHKDSFGMVQKYIAKEGVDLIGLL